MIFEKIQIWPDCREVTLNAYVLKNSKEYKKNEKRPAIVICPGGAYLNTSDREAEPVALRFAALGYHAFVLKYTTYFNQNPDEKISSAFEEMNKGANIFDYLKLNPKAAYPQPLFDLAKAMTMIRRRAEDWCVDTNRITVCGFSAGAHLAANLGVHWQDGFLKEKLGVENTAIKPNALILGYPLLDYVIMKEELAKDNDEMKRGFWELSNKAVFADVKPTLEKMKTVSPLYHVTPQMPPTFIWHTADDPLVYVLNTVRFSMELTYNKIPFELHIFNSGPHGLSLCDETTASSEIEINPHCGAWVGLAVDWMKDTFK